MLVLIDNGHGSETAGKRSPDSRLLEWEWTRQVAHLVDFALRKRGIETLTLVPEERDISLATRVKRANSHDDCILVSIHCNAAENGREWTTATGWSCYTSKGKTRADALAECLYKQADKTFIGRRVRRDKSDGDSDWEENFTLLVKTKCPAVLVENFFMDNKSDVEYLLSDDGKIDCALVIINGVIDYINQLNEQNK